MSYKMNMPLNYFVQMSVNLQRPLWWAGTRINHWQGARTCAKGIWKASRYQMEGKSKDKRQRRWRTNQPWSRGSRAGEWPERLSGWGRGEWGGWVTDWLSLATIDQLSASSVRESVKIQFSCGLFNESAPWCYCKGIGPKSDRALKRPASSTVLRKEDGVYNMEFNSVGRFVLVCQGWIRSVTWARRHRLQLGRMNLHMSCHVYKSQLHYKPCTFGDDFHTNSHVHTNT